MSSASVVVVAHPDDEILWAGGYLAANPGTDVICCTVPKKAPVRCLHFFEVCEKIGAHGIIIADTPDAVGRSTGPLNAVKAYVRQYDEIITHNHLGEYGHPHHIEVHRAMWATGVPMKVFGYGITQDGYLVDLEMKKRLLAHYTTQPSCFKVWSRKFDLSKEALLDVDSISK